MSRQQKSRRRGGLVVTGLVVLALGAFGLNEFGLIGDGGSLFGTETSTNPNQQTTSGTDINDPNSVETVHLTVHDTTIFWNDEEVDEATLVERIEETNANVQYTITDQQAIKETYEVVLDALNEQDRTFTETR